MVAGDRGMRSASPEPTKKDPSRPGQDDHCHQHAACPLAEHLQPAMAPTGRVDEAVAAGGGGTSCAQSSMVSGR